LNRNKLLLKKKLGKLVYSRYKKVHSHYEESSHFSSLKGGYTPY